MQNQRTIAEAEFNNEINIGTASTTMMSMKSKKKSWWRHEKIDDRQRFLLGILQSEEYPEYQREFILSCYEEGMSAEYLNKLAQPGIPGQNLHMMKRILNR